MDVTEILAQREKTHGDFTDHARITQQLKTTLRELRPEGWHKLDDCQKETLDMIAHKIGRVLAGDPNVKDHWDDIAGYATLISQRL